MGAGRSLASWANHGRFTYQRRADGSLKVLYRRGDIIVISPELMDELRAHFAGQEVPIGASRNPPRDSLNAWLRKRLPDVEVPVAYVGPILVAGGVARREGDALRFSDTVPRES